MLAAECLPGTAVTVRAADDFNKFVDGWHGVVSLSPPGGSAAGAIWIDCVNPDGVTVQLLVQPEELEKRNDEAGEN